MSAVLVFYADGESARQVEPDGTLAKPHTLHAALDKMEASQPLVQLV